MFMKAAGKHIRGNISVLKHRKHVFNLMRKQPMTSTLHNNISFHKQVSFKRYLVNTLTLNTYQA